MEKEDYYKRPLEKIFDHFPVQKGISKFYNNLLKKIAETQNKNKEDLLPEVRFCVDWILDHYIKYNQWWESFSASENYKFGDMSVWIEHIWKGDKNREGMIYRPSTHMIIDRISQIARKGAGNYKGKSFTYDDPPPLEEDETLIISVYPPKDGIDKYIKEELMKSGYQE